MNLGSINEQLQAMEEKTAALTDKTVSEFATHMLTLMFRGICFNPLITVVAFWRHTVLLPLSPFGITTATQTKRLIPWLPSFVAL